MGAISAVFWFSYACLLCRAYFCEPRLLPTNHPFVNPNNIGTFGVITAIRAAYKNLKFEWVRIDQVIVFSAIVIGLILAFLYVVSLIMYVLVGPVFAQSITGLFSNPNLREDVALMMMESHIRYSRIV